MYYIAIIAPEAINAQVLIWKRFMRDRFSCVVALKSPAHITLVNPFWLDSNLEHLLVSELESYSNTQKRFQLELKDFNSFQPRVIFVHVVASPDLTQVSRGIYEQLVNKGFPIKNRTSHFYPHITIANRDLLKKDFNTAWDHFKNKKYKASFEVIGITLMKLNSMQWEAAHTAAFPHTN